MSDRSRFKAEFSNFPVWECYLTSQDLKFSSENENKSLWVSILFYLSCLAHGS